MELSKKELNEIIGGGVSGAIITSVIKGISLIYEIGRGIGSSIRRLATRRFC